MDLISENNFTIFISGADVLQLVGLPTDGDEADQVIAAAAAVAVWNCR